MFLVSEKGLRNPIYDYKIGDFENANNAVSYDLSFGMCSHVFLLYIRAGTRVLNQWRIRCFSKAKTAGSVNE